MPAGYPGKTQLEKIAKEVFKRRDRREDREKAILPDDLTGQVYNACMAEGKKIKSRIGWLEEEIIFVKDQISELESKAQAACLPIKRLPIVRSDFFDGEIVKEQPSRGEAIKTDAAIKIDKAEIRPLREYLKRLESEKHNRHVELAELKRIIAACTRGRVALVHHLSQRWLSRLEVGEGVRGTMAKYRGEVVKNIVVRPSDSSGSPLPREALTEDGKADLPPRDLRNPG